MKTICFKMDEKTLHAFKVRIAQSGMTVQDYMNRLIRRSLSEPEDRLHEIRQTRATLDALRKTIDRIDDVLSEMETDLHEVEKEDGISLL